MIRKLLQVQLDDRENQKLRQTVQLGNITIAAFYRYNRSLLDSMPSDTSSRIAATQGFGVPNRIGSLNFCPTCGNLLDVPKDDDVITCAQCGHTEDAVRE